MPKQKTHKATAKRVKISGSGRLLREKTHKRHLLESKPSTRTRRLSGTTEVSPNDAPRVRKLLGI